MWVHLGTMAFAFYAKPVSFFQELKSKPALSKRREKIV